MEEENHTSFSGLQAELKEVPEDPGELNICDSCS